MTYGPETWGMRIDERQAVAMELSVHGICAGGPGMIDGGMRK